MRIAIVHERLDVVGGAEKVILALHRIFPDAPVYTSFVERAKLCGAFDQVNLRSSSMQRLPGSVKRLNDKLLPLYMLAFQEFDLSGYDVVISSSYAAAKSVLTPSSTCHICYCHTPMRYAWDYHADYMRGLNPLLRPGMRLLLQYFRQWDAQTAGNVDYFVANSETVRRRIRKHYRRDARVIMPPVETGRFRVSDSPCDYYLVVSRLVPYKRIDLAIEAFNRLDRQLIIIGEGREQRRLAALAGPNVRILGWQPDEVVARYLSEARALIFPGEEDFGILPVEAQAAGTPVIAYGRGGVMETVIHGETGCFFPEQTADSLRAAVRESETCSFVRRDIACHARQFDESVFCERMDAYVRQCYAEFHADPRDRAARLLKLPEEEIALDIEPRAIVQLPARKTGVA
jgi:glycosyltransferase involved in cell wall biosynthesis